MAMKPKYRPVPDPPGDKENYVLIKSREGPYWRRKRGTLKKATLNSSLKKNAALAGISSAAAKRIRGKLDTYLEEMDTGRFIARVSGRLRKGWNKTGGIDYSFMKGYEMQPHRPMWELFPACPTAYVEKNEVKWNVDISPKTLVRHMKSITGYYFDLVLLSGDASKANALRIQTDTSPLYTFSSKGICKLSINIPEKKPWMVLVKVSCMEGDKMATGSRYNAMKVLNAG
jgi:hypothetical protein